MSTLGFGDITFHSDLGRVFSMGVLLTGTVYMLILLPFSFIRFFYAPWMEAQSEARAVRQVPAETSGHVLLIHHDAVSSTLIHKLTQYHYPYFLVIPTLGDALRLHDAGLKVVMGDLDNPEVYRKLQVQRAAMVATTASDAVNTHVAFTVRELTAGVPIIATADDPASVDILELAGCSYVLQIPEMLGQSLARRVHGSDARAHVIGRYGQLLIAETTATGLPPAPPWSERPCRRSGCAGSWGLRSWASGNGVSSRRRGRKRPSVRTRSWCWRASRNSWRNSTNGTASTDSQRRPR
jgi:voltage-gated potassium channel Kch